MQGDEAVDHEMDLVGDESGITNDTLMQKFKGKKLLKKPKKQL